MVETQYWEEKRGKYVERLHGRGFALYAPPPKIEIKNNLYPLPHEYHNCDACNRARMKHDMGDGFVTVKCGFDFTWKKESKLLADNGCNYWSRKIHLKDQNYKEQ